MAKKGKSSRYGKARSKGKRTPTNRPSSNIYGTKTKETKSPAELFTQSISDKNENTFLQKELSKTSLNQFCHFLLDPEVTVGYKLDMDFILHSSGLGEEINGYDTFKKEFFLKEMEKSWGRLLAPRINELIALNRKIADDTINEVSKNICYVEGLERKQTTLDVPDMLGVFTTKKYKKGKLITKYPIHSMVMPMFDDVSVEDRWFEEDYKKPDSTGTYLNRFIYDREEKGDKDLRSLLGFQPYALGFTGVGTVYGDPRPLLNQNSKYWGHLINDGIYRPGISKESYETQKRNNINHNCEWDGLNILSTKDIDCDEELFLAYGEKYWLGGCNRDKQIQEGTYSEDSDKLPKIRDDVKPKFINHKKGIYAEITSMKEEFLLLNQTKRGYEMVVSSMEAIASLCE
jgi:hypothetical protein